MDPLAYMRQGMLTHPFLSLLPGKPIFDLHPLHKLVSLPFHQIDLLIHKVAPHVLRLAFALLPVRLDLVPVHGIYLAFPSTNKTVLIYTQSVSMPKKVEARDIQFTRAYESTWDICRVDDTSFIG